MEIRMKTALLASLLVVAIGFVQPVAARTNVPLIHPAPIAVATASGKPVTPEQVRGAILGGAVSKGWQPSDAGPGKITANILVRNKHRVVLDIAYDTRQITITYRESTNLDYEMVDGKALIHPNYNRWIQNLIQGIRVELVKL